MALALRDFYSPSYLNKYYPRWYIEKYYPYTASCLYLRDWHPLYYDYPYHRAVTSLALDALSESRADKREISRLRHEHGREVERLESDLSVTKRSADDLQYELEKVKSKLRRQDQSSASEKALREAEISRLESQVARTKLELGDVQSKSLSQSLDLQRSLIDLRAEIATSQARRRAELYSQISHETANALVDAEVALIKSRLRSAYL